MGKCLHCGKELTDALCCNQETTIDQIRFLFPLTDSEMKEISIACDQSADGIDSNPEHFHVIPWSGGKNATLIRYSGQAGVVLVPVEVNGLKIVEIADGAFWGNKKIEYISLPAGLRKIGAGAFAYCNKLEHVFFRGEVQQIDDTAFLKSPVVLMHIVRSPCVADFAKKYRIATTTLNYKAVQSVTVSGTEVELFETLEPKNYPKLKVFSWAVDHEERGVYALCCEWDETVLESGHEYKFHIVSVDNKSSPCTIMYDAVSDLAFLQARGLLNRFRWDLKDRTNAENYEDLLPSREELLKMPNASEIITQKIVELVALDWLDEQLAELDRERETLWENACIAEKN